MPAFPNFQPGDWISADTLNAIIAELERQGKVFLDGGELSDGPGGVMITPPPEPNCFWAEILTSHNVPPGSSVWYHDWREVRPTAAGTWEAHPSGRNGTYLTAPAVEVNWRQVPGGARIVWMEEGSIDLSVDPPLQFWIFFHCGGDCG